MTMYSNKEIWRVTYPILLGLLAQNIINVTDTAFLGPQWEASYISVSIQWHSVSV